MEIKTIHIKSAYKKILVLEKFLQSRIQRKFIGIFLSSIFRKIIGYTVILALIWSNCLWATKPLQIIEDYIDESTILRAQGLPFQSLEAGEAIHVKGLLQSTHKDIFIRTKGDVYLDRVYAAGDLHIETPGSIFFENETLVKGAVKIKAKDVQIKTKFHSGDQFYAETTGILNLFGEGEIYSEDRCSLISKNFVLEGIFKAEKGATFNVGTLTNKGMLSAFGRGLQGKICKLINNGKIDISQAHVTIDEGVNKKNAALRTKGHFIFDGNTFANHGMIFTLGTHQANLRAHYMDDGILFNPALLLLNAPTVELVNHHSFLREGIITAAINLDVNNNTNFYLRSHQDKCFLQFGSKGYLNYNGKLTQTSAPFPLGGYYALFELSQTSILKEQTSFPFFQNLATDLSKLSLDPWNKMRNHLDSGITFYVNQDEMALNGNVSLEAGSVRKIIKGKLTSIGTSLKAGSFTGDYVQVESKNAFLKDSDFFSLSGAISLLVHEKAHLQHMDIQGETAANGRIGSLKMENSFIKSVSGPTHIQVEKEAEIKNSTMQAKGLSTISAQSLQASGLKTHAERNYVDIQKSANISQSTFTAEKENWIKSGENLTSISNSLSAGQNTLLAKNINTTSDTVQGKATLAAQENLNIRDIGANGHVAAFATNITFSGKVKTPSLNVEGKERITNKADLQATEDMALKAPDIDQLAKTKGKNLYIEASKNYNDTSESLNEAEEELNLIAKNAKDINGRQKAKIVRNKFQNGNLQKLLNQTEATTYYADLEEAEIVFPEDFLIKYNLHLWAKSLENKETLTTNGHFIAHMQTTALNKGIIDIHGKGLLEAEESFTNLKNIYGREGLGIKTKGLLTHKGLFSGGLGALEIEAHQIDAVAEGLDKRSVFLGDTIYAKSDTDFLADAAILRARDATFIAGDLLSLGAYVETFHSTKVDSSFFGITTTWRTWQEGAVFDANCTESLKLFSLNRQVRGAGALLSSPFLKVHGEKGAVLEALQLINTEEVQKIRPCFELLGTDLFNPFEDGPPMPKPSIEAGTRLQTTRTIQSYGLLGNISAKRFELSTGAEAVASLQGSHLAVDRLVTNTPFLKLGGATFEIFLEEIKGKFTAGVAYVGYVTPTASVYVSSNMDSVKGLKSAQVQIGHIENLSDGMQMSASNGIIGGIYSGSGQKFGATIDYTQTVVSQSGWSANASITGSNIALGVGARGGENRSSEGTSFDIFNAPNLIYKIEPKYNDSDTRWGFNISLGFSLDGSSIPSFKNGSGSLQIKDQSLAFNTSMVQDWQGASSTNGSSSFTNTIGQTQNILERTQTVTTGASNVLALAHLAGAREDGLQRVLNDVNTGLRGAQCVVGWVTQAHQIYDVIDTMTDTPASQEMKIPTSSLKAEDLQPNSIDLPDTSEASPDNLSTSTSKRRHHPASLDTALEIVDHGDQRKSTFEVENEDDTSSISLRNMEKGTSKKEKSDIETHKKFAEEIDAPKDMSPDIDPLEFVPGMAAIREAKTLKGVAKVVGKTAISHAASKLNKLPERAGEKCGELAEETADYFGVSPGIKKAASAAASFVCSEATSIATSVLTGKIGHQISNASQKKMGKRRENRISDRGEPDTIQSNPSGTTYKKYGKDGWVQKEFNKGHSGPAVPQSERVDHIHDYKPNPFHPEGRPLRQQPGRAVRNKDKVDLGLINQTSQGNIKRDQ